MTDTLVAAPGRRPVLYEVENLLSTPDVVTVGNGTTQVGLPPELASVLRDAASAMIKGQAVTVTAMDQVMTTQEAADFLGVSRPSVVRLIDEGQIPSTRPGHHRRVLLADLMAYQDRTRRERARVVDDMTRESQSYPHFGGGFVATR